MDPDLDSPPKDRPNALTKSEGTEPGSPKKALLWVFFVCSCFVLAAGVIASRSRAKTAAMLSEARVAALDPHSTQMRKVKAAALSQGVDSTESIAKVQTFSMDVTEVTVAAYRSCVASGFCKPQLARAGALTTGPSALSCALEEDPERPVNCVDQTEARVFCGHVGKRLPTEAEWELAARSSGQRDYPWGRSLAEKGLSCFGTTRSCPVASFVGDRSDGGLFDMGGNLHEWVEEVGLTKGGAFDSAPADLRSALRHPLGENERRENVGFRCAK